MTRPLRLGTKALYRVFALSPKSYSIPTHTQYPWWYQYSTMAEPPRKKLKKPKKEEDVKDIKPVLNGAGPSDQDFMTKLTNSRLGCACSILKFKFNKKRVQVLTESEDFKEDHDGIVYWMSRDQRVQDNWAFLYAQKVALQLEVPLHVCFCLMPKFLDATIRHFKFMLKGLQEVEQECKDLSISFHLLTGYAQDVLPKFLDDHNIGGVVTDFNPLREPRSWVDDLIKALPEDVPLCQVDAHNLVPCWIASPKREYGARTIRKKIHDQLPSFMTEFPPVIRHKYLPKTKPEPIDWEAAEASLDVDMTVGEVDWAIPGSNAGLKELEEFCQKRLKFFGPDRNNPNKAALSNLSPWIHFGQISVQRCILTVKQFKGKFKDSVDAFIEEAVIRRELSDNFCYYCDKYDSIEGAYEWAQTTLQVHAKDKREKIYTRKQFEEAKTHDDLWNAAQIQLVKEGKMHGFLRMYWAKKILEWTPSPEEALRTALYLNDRFSLDGTDPNGFVGCAWSICGIHDQGWAERPVFGKIRYMNYKGCQRKFDVAQFVRKYGAKKY